MFNHKLFQGMKIDFRFELYIKLFTNIKIILFMLSTKNCIFKYKKKEEFNPEFVFY